MAHVLGLIEGHHHLGAPTQRILTTLGPGLLDRALEDGRLLVTVTLRASIPQIPIHQVTNRRKSSLHEILLYRRFNPI